jgi:hypothetical protein
MNLHLLTFVFATATRDMWVVLGGLVAIVLLVFWWVRREDRKERERLDAQESQDQGPQPGPAG